MTTYAGVFHVLVTPFAEDGGVDVAALRGLVAFAIAHGATGLTALGVNGEAHSLDEHERELVARAVLQAAEGAVPVVLGASAPDPKVAARRSADAQRWGADAAMVACPPSAADLDAHVGAVTAATPGFDLVLQDYPASGHEPVSVAALAAVCAAHAEIRCVKAEDPPTPRKVAALAAGADVAQLGGLGGLHLLAELDAGTDGTMTGFAFPEVLAAIVAAADAGDREGADRLYQDALEALTWEAQPEIGLALRKLLLAERGLLPCPRLRHPVPLPADAAQQARDIAATVTQRQQEVRS